MSSRILPSLANRSPNLAEKIERLRVSARRGLTPPPRISVPEWADRYRWHARGAGSTSGRWKTSTVEVARGPMLSVTEPGVHIIDVMTATQLLKTSLIENIAGFHAHLDPCPMLLVEPKDDAAEKFAKERIIPMIKATPALRRLISPNRKRLKGRTGERSPEKEVENTLTFHKFPGGFLALTGAGSPDNLARRPVRIVLYDEIDKYPVTREGDPIALGDERTATFVNWLSARACSPTVEDESRIAKGYAESDQRRASVECPHCQHRQFLDFFRHVEWSKDENGEHQPRTARIYCEACGTGWSEGERLQALQTIRWHQTRPFICCGRMHSPLDAYEKAWRSGASVATSIDGVWDWWTGPRWAVYRAKCPTCGKWGVDNEHAGFQASKLFSPWVKDRPDRIAAKWLAAKGDEEAKQVWWNTQLGLPYRPRVGRDIKSEALLERREVWAAQVPDGVAVITCGVDTQDDRLEFEIVGWGRGEESWSLAYGVLEGDPDQQEVWDRLDSILLSTFHRADGRPFSVAAACVDSGGHRTQAVYAFCRARRQRKVWAIKGNSETSGNRSPVWPSGRATRRRSKDYKPFIIGTNAAKDRISSCLQIEAPGRGYMHFPADRDAGYFAQLTGERLVVKKRSGKSYRIWEAKRGQAHEALDCRVYAYAALWGLIVQHKFDMDREAARIGAAEETPVVRADTPEGQRIAANKASDPEPVAESPASSAKPPVRRRKVGKSKYLSRIGR